MQETPRRLTTPSSTSARWEGASALPMRINDNGQIDGFSTLPGDSVVHSFLIENGMMTDLGTLGGPNSESFASLNEVDPGSGHVRHFDVRSER